MNNEIEQLAEQHSMTVEFVAWFFGEKKAACGSFWLMMMAAMWEGWKGRETESTAALATIEKCREVSGCPAGVDLQDHLRQLAAENVALNRVPETDSVAMLLALDSFRSESLPDVGLQKAFESLMYHRKTPATDAYLAGIKADGVEEMASTYRGFANEDGCSVNMKCSYNLSAERAESYAAYIRRQLRESKGAQS